MITLTSHTTAAPDPLAGKHDRALVLMGFVGGFRRSELTSLKVADLRWTEVRKRSRRATRRSKTDQEGQGSEVAVLWTASPHTDSAGITDCPVFRPMGKNGRCGKLRRAGAKVKLADVPRQLQPPLPSFPHWRVACLWGSHAESVRSG